MSLLVILFLPLLTVVLSLLPLGKRFAPCVTFLSSLVVLILTIRDALSVTTVGPVVGIANWIAIDGLSALVLLLVALLGLTASLFSWGYIEKREHDPKRTPYYYAHFNLFLFALIAVPVVVEPNLVWIALEATALFSVLLVAFENTHEALEAAWKYIALMFMGAAIALLGFLILFWAYKSGGGKVYTWQGLCEAAPQMSPVLVKTAFLMILVGFGMKVGFVPLHTWLPDAHSQAPTPVCALLSGVKTTVAIYVILRLLPLLPADSHANLWMQTIGLISVGVAAFLLLQVRDYKRLFAYSTVEHMGIILTAVGLGTSAGHYGAMVQMFAHSLTKSFCFFAAGATMLVVDTRQIGAVRGLIRTSPAAGAALLFGGLAIAGAPPFVVFLSEFSIFKAGLAQGAYLVTTLLVLFITIAFFGILMHVNRMVFGQPDTASTLPRARLPVTTLLTLILAAIPLVVLGVYLPMPLHRLFTQTAASLVR